MDAGSSSYYHHPPPPSHYPYYQPAAEVPQPPLSYSHFRRNSPPLASHYDLPPPLSRHDELRTLFVAGLPDDVKHREIYNLFREFPGYRSSQLRISTDHSHPYAFVVFADQRTAVAAQHALNGLLFDLEKESTLYIELAKSNSRSSKRSKTGDGSNTYTPGMGKSSHSTIGYPSTQSHTRYDYGAPHGGDPLPTSEAYVPQNNPPCATLFVANLGTTCSEKELAQIFRKFPGFLKLKMQNRNGVPVAFVDFEDTGCSTEALNRLQGTPLHSTYGEPMRLEYAKSRMGLRKRER
ncbi:U2 small nuclear ribonucleoprotein B'' 2 [Apostasia shenzhenica]|uniref:U2 small nuclear ribonucleoprotein B'' 2 n=1 Tax=Apostasia shenzhenica TaxID=1088818 RepID=A0A2I0AQS7_9ASPA|nr:U2 small nuclear ribonucleoprotein B'' 2 [Apostasia shenzhenica]